MVKFMVGISLWDRVRVIISTGLKVRVRVTVKLWSV